MNLLRSVTSVKAASILQRSFISVTYEPLINLETLIGITSLTHYSVLYSNPWVCFTLPRETDLMHQDTSYFECEHFVKLMSLICFW